MTFSWRTSDEMREGGFSRFNQNSRENYPDDILWQGGNSFRRGIVGDNPQNVINKFEISPHKYEARKIIAM